MTLVLLHSPLVGPLTWRAVAARLPGAVTPDLSGAVTHASIAERVAARLEDDGPVVLVGHSGAGPLLPRIARTVRQPVAALIYVDSVLPHPGQSWIQNAPADLVDHLRGLARDGVLPPWNEWFDPAALAELLPDDEMRAAFVVAAAPAVQLLRGEGVGRHVGRAGRLPAAERGLPRRRRDGPQAGPGGGRAHRPPPGDAHLTGYGGRRPPEPGTHGSADHQMNHSRPQWRFTRWRRSTRGRDAPPPERRATTAAAPRTAGASRRRSPPGPYPAPPSP